MKFRHRIGRALGSRIRRYSSLILYWRMPSWEKLPAKQAFRMAYNVVLGREPDPTGTADLLPKLLSNELSYRQLVLFLCDSEEFRASRKHAPLGSSLHASRSDFIQSLPRAKRILDLGGTHLHNEYGAFVQMGYPYSFDELTIVDLPNQQRHSLYRQDRELYKGEFGKEPKEKGEEGISPVQTPLGPVFYRYHSMVDLSGIQDSTVDLVYMGQSIEHVTFDDADTVLKEVLRVLVPGGYLALDTPNGEVTRLQQDEFIDPDHKFEYTHAQLSAKLKNAGFEIISAVGLNWDELGAIDEVEAEANQKGAKTGIFAGGDKPNFSTSGIASHKGMFADITNCYLLAYVCRKPEDANAVYRF
ncbi:MAG: methyltransferase domain-containing protein [Actinobacteria bacterium]|nr:methyltransferase domain-containing protein [Actinomycetota bacterium]MCL6104792.1 methyltransferase domain-containing protein [Actinomycetota bacterium]